MQQLGPPYQRTRRVRKARNPNSSPRRKQSDPDQFERFGRHFGNIASPSDAIPLCGVEELRVGTVARALAEGRQDHRTANRDSSPSSVAPLRARILEIRRPFRPYCSKRDRSPYHSVIQRFRSRKKEAMLKSSLAFTSSPNGPRTKPQRLELHDSVCQPARLRGPEGLVIPLGAALVECFSSSQGVVRVLEANRSRSRADSILLAASVRGLTVHRVHPQFRKMSRSTAALSSSVAKTAVSR